VKNVAVKIDESDNRRPVKDRSADKIDGAVALIMAVGVQIATGDKSSVYDRGQGL
jgi:phage terminase large subunit-like protein